MKIKISLAFYENADIQYICNIRERKDIFLLDLDEQSFEQAKDAILNLIQEE